MNGSTSLEGNKDDVPPKEQIKVVQIDRAVDSIRVFVSEDVQKMPEKNVEDSLEGVL